MLSVVSLSQNIVMIIVSYNIIWKYMTLHVIPTPMDQLLLHGSPSLLEVDKC